MFLHILQGFHFFSHVQTNILLSILSNYFQITFYQMKYKICYRSINSFVFFIFLQISEKLTIMSSTSCSRYMQVYGLVSVCSFYVSVEQNSNLFIYYNITQFMSKLCSTESEKTAKCVSLIYSRCVIKYLCTFNINFLF